MSSCAEWKGKHNLEFWESLNKTKVIIIIKKYSINLKHKRFQVLFNPEDQGSRFLWNSHVYQQNAHGTKTQKPNTDISETLVTTHYLTHFKQTKQKQA
jgi:hypothetical protein